jgi:hypothetical protein
MESRILHGFSGGSEFVNAPDVAAHLRISVSRRVRRAFVQMCLGEVGEVGAPPRLRPSFEAAPNGAAPQDEADLLQQNQPHPEVPAHLGRASKDGRKHAAAPVDAFN